MMETKGGRPNKQGIDYFPVDTNFQSNIEMYLVETGAEGLSVLLTIQQLIYGNYGYYVDNNDDLPLLIKQRIRIEPETSKKCINAALKRGIFNQELEEKYKILTSEDIQGHFFHATKRREKIYVTKDYLLIDVSAYKNLINVDRNHTKYSIVEYSKEKLPCKQENSTTTEIFAKAETGW